MQLLQFTQKVPVACGFILASKQCQTKKITKIAPNLFKMNQSHLERFHKKTHFCSLNKKFSIFQSFFPIAENLPKIIRKKNAQTISSFGFVLLYPFIHFILLYPLIFKQKF